MKTQNVKPLALAVTLLLIHGQAIATQPPSSRSMPAQAVTSTTVQSVTQQRTLTALGTLKANQSVNIAPRIAGQITHLGINDGQEVGKNAVLIKLDARAQQANVKMAQVELADAQRQLASRTALYARKAVSKDELDAQTAQGQRLNASLESQMVTLDYHTIKAPFSGILGFSDISHGAMVNNNEVITTLDDLSTMKLSFELPENVLNQIKPGALVSARSESWPDTVFEGNISAINPRIDVNNLTFTSQASIDNSDQKLRPGMPVRITIMQEPTNSLVVPARSVLFDGHQQYVYVINEQNTANRRMITVGQSTEDTIEVLGGLSVGERIIDEGVIKAREGTRVQIMGDQLAGDQQRTKANTAKEARS